jgi:hypothetical protein
MEALEEFEAYGCVKLKRIWGGAVGTQLRILILGSSARML